MSKKTTNLGLDKPEMTDTPGLSIPQIANNFDLIDQNLNAHAVSLAQNTSKLTDIGYYISSSNKNTDIATILQNALNDPTIGIVHVPAGNYTLSHPVTIPKQKQLILTGHLNGEYCTNSEASPLLFTILTPTFDGDYLFYMSDQSTLRHGFLDCSSMTTGGGIKIDFSQTTISRVSIDKTILYGGNKWNLYAIFLNGDRPANTLAGEAYFLDIKVGVYGFGIGVYLLRQNTYTVADGSTTGIAWITGINISGSMTFCQRYVYFNTSNNLWAGASSIIRLRLQGAPVPTKTTPAIELGGNDTIIDTQFFDINASAPNQTMKLKLNNTNDMVVIKGFKGASDIIDTGADTVYVQSGVASQITSITTGETISNGWYVVSGAMCTVHMTITQLAVHTGWTTIYTLPFYSKYTSKKMVITDDNSFINVMTSGNNLQVINNNATAKNVTLQISYPIN